MNGAIVVMSALATGRVVAIASAIRSAARRLIRLLALAIVISVLAHTSRTEDLHTLLTLWLHR